MRTKIRNYKQTLFQYIIQYALNNNKNQIHKIPNPNYFSEYVEFSLITQQTVFQKILCQNKSNAYQTMYMLITQNDLCTHTKFHAYNSTINNIFKNKNHEYIILFKNYFYLCQKIYHNLIKFFNICKIKMKKSRNQYDLQDNIININNSLPLIHNNELYCFSKNDIIKLFYNSLINSNYEFNNDPCRIKNPYTNIHFELSHLYNMFFYIKHNTICNIHPIIRNFYNCNFNIPKFVINFENDITELNIKRFINNGQDYEIYKYVRHMIFQFNDDIAKKQNLSQILLFKHFPINAYNEIFKPYLVYYLNWKTLTCTTKSFNNWVLFKNKMTRFSKKTPTFGRILISLNRNNKQNNFTRYNNSRLYKKNNRIFRISYNLEYINFNNNNKSTLDFNKYLSHDMIENVYNITELDSKNGSFSESDNESDSETESDNESDYVFSPLLIEQNDEENDIIDQDNINAIPINQNC